MIQSLVQKMHERVSAMQAQEVYPAGSCRQTICRSVYIPAMKIQKLGVSQQCNKYYVLNRVNTKLDIHTNLYQIYLFYSTAFQQATLTTNFCTAL